MTTSLASGSQRTKASDWLAASIGQSWGPDVRAQGRQPGASSQGPRGKGQAPEARGPGPGAQGQGPGGARRQRPRAGARRQAPGAIFPGRRQGKRRRGTGSRPQWLNGGIPWVPWHGLGSQEDLGGPRSAQEDTWSYESVGPTNNHHNQLKILTDCQRSMGGR